MSERSFQFLELDWNVQNFSNLTTRRVFFSYLLKALFALNLSQSLQEKLAIFISKFLSELPKLA